MKLGSNVGVLRVGSTAVAAVKRGTDRVYDADVAAFQKASDAADVTGIMDLVDYLKGQSLWDYARFYPMKSSQNAGSGSTVYGLGGLTTNNITLVNSPTWGSDGVTFDAASSQYASSSDFLSDESIYLWWRGSSTTEGVGVLIAQYGGAGDQRSVQMYTNSGELQLSRSADGVSGSVFSDGTTPSSDTLLVAEWVDGGGRNLWKNKANQSLTLTAGTAKTSRFDSNADVTIMSQPSGAAPASGTVVLAGFIETALTTTQRETITDLINAL
jgi:hypothetical protein